MAEVVSTGVSHMCDNSTVSVKFIYFFCPRVKDVLGYDPEMLIKGSIKITDCLHPADQPLLLSGIAKGNYYYYYYYLGKI